MTPAPLRTRLSQVRARIEKRVRRALFGSTPTWRRRPNTLPWFDRPDALSRLDDFVSRNGAVDRALLERWIRDGYVVVDGIVDTADIDTMIATLDTLWDAPRPIPHLTLLDLREEAHAEPRNLSHRDLLALPPPVRERMREASHWRIHGFHYVNPAARRLYHNRRLRRVASALFDRGATPIAAINFMAGSEQALHQDMAVFHVYPHNYLIGAWIACEDIAAESGPLVLYPGSHRTRMFPEFTDYPQTNLRTAEAATAGRYQEYVVGLALRFERHEFHARKGQVLLWHGMLIHGGTPVTRQGLTRKSMVIHYSIRGADRGREVEGPFNW